MNNGKYLIGYQLVRKFKCIDTLPTYILIKSHLNNLILTLI